jgi:hypothetical protein
MYKLLNATTGFQRVNVSYLQAIMYTLPIIIVELTILMIFSFVDPPRQGETFGSANEGDLVHITCEQNSSAFFITQLVYDGMYIS